MVAEWHHDRRYESQLRHPSVTGDLFYTLTLHVRYHLKQYPMDGETATIRWSSESNDPYPIIPWPEEEWRRFKTGFYRVVMEGWDDRFWLRAQRPWPARVYAYGQPFVPNIRCRLALYPSDEPSAHCVAICAHTASGWHGSYPPNAGTYLPDFGGEFMRQTEGWSIRLLQNSLQTSETSGSNPAVHEFGHFLGLPHPFGRTNAWEDYGATSRTGPADLPPTALDRMGLGGQVHPWHAYPWLNAIRFHLSDWASSWFGVPPVGPNPHFYDDSIFAPSLTEPEALPAPVNAGAL